MPLPCPCLWVPMSRVIRPKCGDDLWLVLLIPLMDEEALVRSRSSSILVNFGPLFRGAQIFDSVTHGSHIFRWSATKLAHEHGRHCLDTREHGPSRSAGAIVNDVIITFSSCRTGVQHDTRVHGP